MLVRLDCESLKVDLQITRLAQPMPFFLPTLLAFPPPTSRLALLPAVSPSHSQVVPSTESAILILTN